MAMHRFKQEMSGNGKKKPFQSEESSLICIELPGIDSLLPPILRVETW
jgi:hypothetical protein